MNFLKISIWGGISLGFCSCMNPTAKIQPGIESFKKNHPHQIQSFTGTAGPMQYAWTGNPKKRPLLFVHGSPGSWDAWVEFLENKDLQKNFHVIAIDRPGYGGSLAGVSETSLQKQGAEVFEVLKFNESHLPAILVGHSFGGPVIAKMAMDYPQQIAGLIFVAGSLDPDLEKTKWYQYPASWWPIKYLIPTDLRVCNEEIMPLKGELTALLPDWEKISAKAILIQGDQDDLVPKENYDFLLKKLKPSLILRANLYPGVNHFIPWQHPDFILSAIGDLNASF